MHVVYILRSIKDGGFYIGCTSDMEARLAAHNAGRTQSLKHRRPLEVIYSETYHSQAEAYQRERQLKSYKGGAAFKKLLSGGVA